MRYALLLGRRHGETELSALAPAGVPDELRAEYHRLLGEPSDLAELHFLTSDEGVIKRNRFAPPADQQPADEQPADEQPADEQPADEQPADEQPAANEAPSLRPKPRR